MHAKISSYQVIAVMALAGAFAECMNIPNDVSEYTMQRFAVLIISNALLFLLCIPLIILSKKYPNDNFFSIIVQKSKVLGWIVLTILGLHLMAVIVFLIDKFEFYVQNTIMSTAASPVLVALFFIAVSYGFIKGLQAIMRTSIIMFYMFIGFLLLLGIALFIRMNFNYFYPTLIETPKTLVSEIIPEIFKKTEIYVFLILCKHIDKKPHRAISLYVPIVFSLTMFMNFLYTAVLGPYLQRVSFPFYAVSSLADIIILDRLDGIDLVIWTITTVLQVIAVLLSIKSMLSELIDEKKAQIATLPIILIVGVLSLFGATNRSRLVKDYSIILMGIVFVIFIVGMPIISYFIKKGLDKNDKNKETQKPEEAAINTAAN